jgi:YVTN family beta-propeller protein
VGFSSRAGEASTIHTALSLLWPTGAIRDGNVQFSPTSAFKAAIDFVHPAPKDVATVQLDTPGLYVFICDIHVYMFAAVIVDDPATPGLDLGEQISLVNFPAGEGVATTSNLAARLLRTFFIITDPANWLDYRVPGNYHVTYPNVDVRATGGAVVNLNTYLSTLVPGIENDQPKAALFKPTTPAVGEIWVDTQFELTAGKGKPGTATAINGADWTLTKKIALPSRNMNHPHNMWTDKDQKVIYQTQWFDERVAVFDRTTGAFIRELNAGPAPSHVMTRANNDLVHVAQNGGNNVREFDTLANKNVFITDIPMRNDMVVAEGDIVNATHPHGHWMSATGDLMVTPNENVNTSTVYKFPAGAILATIPTGHVPIATGMMPDSTKYYVANFLDSSISVMDMATNTEIKKIDLLEKYNPVEGCYDREKNPTSTPLLNCSFVGGLPIQTPVSPDGTNMVTANTLTATITVVDTKTDTVVATLPCDPGCHGVQYGAKAGGGYYAYVASKFSNAMIVVDPAPGGDPSKAAIVGRLLLAGNASAVQDDTVRDKNTDYNYMGMGGQGVLPVPVVYNGWVQQWVDHCNTKDCKAWKGQLTSDQKYPGSVTNHKPARGNSNK